MAVYGAEGVEEWWSRRVKRPRGGCLWFRSGALGLVESLCLRGWGDDLVEDAVDVGCGGDELSRVGGADVEKGGGGLGDGVDGGAAGDVAHVDRGEGVGGELSCGDLSQGVAEEEDRIGSAGVSPGVAAGAGDGDAEAEAAEGSGDDGRVATAFKRDGGCDTGAIRAAFKEVTHAAEIAFALFAYIGGEDDGDGWGDLRVTEGRGNGEKSGEAGSVVADSGGERCGGCLFFGGIMGVPAGKTVSRWAERRIQGVVCDDRPRIKADQVFVRFLFCRAEFGEGVAGVVEMDVGQAELLEALEEPGGACGFSEGWGGNADEFQLPLAELGLVEMQPVKGAMDSGEGCEARDAALSG